MATKPEEGKGILWTNDKKGNPKAPDFKGSMTVNDVEMRISGWSRNASTGPCISLMYNPPLSSGDASKAYPREAKSKFDDQDVPF